MTLQPQLTGRELPSNLADGELVYLKAFINGIRPDPKLSVSQWADAHRIVSQKGSSEPGPWRTGRTPYLREPMDCLSAASPVRDIVFKKGTQVGGTEAGLNWLGYIIDHVPGPAMVIWPTSQAAKRNSKQRITPLIEETPRLRSKVRAARSRDSGNTTAMKEFPGGVLVIAGANSATELKSTPVRYLLCDEVDEYPPDVDDQGDPIDLARKRTTNFPRAKRLYVSTPTVKGFSRIDDLYSGGEGEQYNGSDQRRYYVPCPECNGEQWLKWAQIRWETRRGLEYQCTACGLISLAGDVDIGKPYECPGCHEARPAVAEVLREVDTSDITSVWYECEHCEARIDEHHKTEMLERGRWIAEKPGPNRAAGFHLSALYSPLGWYSWRDAVSDYLAAKRSDEKLKVWTNTVLGEVYEDAGEQPDHNILRDRAEPGRLGVVPTGALLLVAAVDVQADRLECKVKGFGRDEESWLVDYQTFYGDPAVDGGPWEALDEYLGREFPHQDGASLRITATAVDSGYQTHVVYNFCRQHRRRHVFPVKGIAGQGRPALGRPRDQDVNHRGRTIKAGVKLWPLGVDTIKALVYARLRLTEPGAHYLHFPSGLPDDYFEQLTAERLVVVYPRGYPRQEWHKPKGKRNEALDLEVYCYAAALYSGLTRMNWDKREQALKLRQRDLFNTPPAETKADVQQEGEDVDTDENKDLVPTRKVGSPAKRKRNRFKQGRRAGGFVSRVS